MEGIRMRWSRMMFFALVWLVPVLALVACGGDKEKSTQTAKSTTSSAKKPAPEATPATTPAAESKPAPTPTAESTPAPAPMPATEPAAAGTQGRTAALEAVIKGAVAEGGKLDILDGGFTLPAQWDAIEKGIKAKFGVTVDISSAESGGGQPALAQRLMQELKAGQKPSTEVFRGTITTFPELIEAGALEPVDWLALDPKIPPEAIEGPHGEALAVSSRIGGVAYNTKLVTGDDIPEKLSDLLKPKWKGLIASTPYPAGFDRAVFQTDPKVLVNFMFDFVEGGNFAGFLGCGAGDVTRVANGEFAMMALICSDSTVEQLKSQGAPIEISFLKETSNASHTYFGVVKNAPHPNTAKLLLLYLVSPEGQKLMRKYTFADMAFVEGNVEYQRVKDLKARGFNVPNVNLQTYANHRDLFKKWQRVFVRIRRGEIKRGDLQ